MKVRYQPLDRVFCVREGGGLVKGRVYTVAKVIDVPSCVDCGLVLAGVPLPFGAKGWWSNRVIPIEEARVSCRLIEKSDQG